jgi:hypothetical protein
MITITAFPSVPPFAQGLVRDLRVRWALEEAGLRYNVRLLEQGEGDKPEYRALQPFGQVPIYMTILSSSNRAPSCSTSASAARCSCRRIPRHALAQRSG